MNCRSFLHLKSDEILRVPGVLSDIRSVHGDVVMTIPFAACRGENGIEKDDAIQVATQTLRIRAYGDQILRLTLDPDCSIEEETPMLHLDPALKQVALFAKGTETGYEVCDNSGVARARINMQAIQRKRWSDLMPDREKQFELELLPDGVTSVPLKSYDMFAHGMTDSIPIGYVEEMGDVVRSLFSFQADANERFAGTGERFAKMDLSGRTLTLENTDGLGVNSNRTYKNVPFYLSSKPYGLFLHTSSRTHLSLADQSTRAAQGLVEEAGLDLFLIGGGNASRILYNYCRITGFSPQLPLWSYGIWMSRMTYFTADEVEHVAIRLRDEDFPCDVLHLDTGWFAKDWVCEWAFSRERFPDPAAFMQRLRNRGFRTTLWQTPDISEKSDVYSYAKEKGYLPSIKEADEAGSDFSMQPIAGSIDFTNPSAYNWYQNDLLKPLLEMGAAAIKTDFGEIINMDGVYHGLPPGRLRNRYALLYQKAAFEVTEKVYGKGEALVWARAGWAGCQRYPLHWGGDAECSWEGMAGSLRGGLHLGLSGFTYWSHDVPGFHGTPDFMNSWPSEDLYVRWTQFGVFSSHIRYHGTSPREPYEFPAVADIVRQWWKLRYMLIPYIQQQAGQSAERGVPMVRAMLLEDELDPTCWMVDDQYMFGDDFLVAPVMTDSGIRDVYLPAGEWVDFWTGEVQTGQKWLRNVTSPLHQMPVLVKREAEIPVYPESVSCTDEMIQKRCEVITGDMIAKGFNQCKPLWNRAR